MTAAEFAAGLRLIADHYDANPEMPVMGGGLTIYPSNREEFINAAVQLAKGGTVRKVAEPTTVMYPRFKAERMFGEVKLSINIDRKDVCRLVRPAEYDCPDSLLEEAKEYAEAE